MLVSASPNFPRTFRNYRGGSRVDRALDRVKSPGVGGATGVRLGCVCTWMRASIFSLCP